MSAQEIADNADMIVAGYAYKIMDDYIVVTDLNDISKRAVIQNGEIVESLMDDNEDDIALQYYQRNSEILKESLSA